MKTTLTTALVMVLLVSSLASLQFVGVGSANPDGFMPQLSMPIEHVNYTITSVKGTLWAQVDGQYPIRIIRQEGCSFSELPMVYPMPPNTTNIHVYLDDKEVAWSNYTQAYAGELHHTAIGDWWMIYAPLTNLSDDFTLKIHYEHPLETANSSYLFLYDLNISPYLSEKSQNSTVIFTVHFNTNLTDLQVYTAPPDSPASQWQPKTYTTTTQGASKTVTIVMDSAYDTQLVGDLVVEFSSLDGVPEFSVWVVFGLLAAGICAGLLFHKRQKRT